MLGLPASLRDDDIDQEMPTEVDDEFITEWNILSHPTDQPSITVGCNVYTQLMGIISKITKYIYPLKAPLVDGKGLIPLDLVKEIEQDLEHWRTSIPKHLVQPVTGSRFFKYLHPLSDLIWQTSRMATNVVLFASTFALPIFHTLRYSHVGENSS